MTAIRTELLTKFYGRVVGIDTVTFAVEEGEVFGFLGPNGSGKTTTIRVLLDLVRPTSGRATIFGFDTRAEGRQARERLGYLPGELPVYPELTGERYLDYLRKVGQRPVGGAFFDRLLRRFDVSDADLRRPMREYSHGMKRKLGIVQAMMADPPLLVLDEPTSGLDPLMIEAFAETVHELKRRGRTVFLSSHVLTEVERTCDRVGLVRHGRLIAVRSLADFGAGSPVRSPLEEYVLRMYAGDEV
jgi:ABC-2 type transport system ATP-binding protein